MNAIIRLGKLAMLATVFLPLYLIAGVADGLWRGAIEWWRTTREKWERNA